MLGITLVGALLRLVHLDTTIAFDEAITVRRFVEGGLPSIVSLYGGYGSTNNHVLNSFLALASVRVFGESVWALRLPAFLFGVATIPLLASFARRCTRSALVGRIAALLAAGSPLLVEYTPACRGYAPLVFFAVLSAWLLLAILEVPRGRVRCAVGFATAVFAAGWSHMSALVFAAALGAALACEALASWRQPSPAQPGVRSLVLRAGLPLCLAVGALVLWYSRASLILRDVQSRVVHGTFVDPSLAGLKSVHDDQNVVAWAVHTGKDFFGTRGLVLPLLLPLVAWAAVRHVRLRGRRSVLLICSVCVPPVALLAARLLPFPRYFFFVQPFLLVLVAIGLVAAGDVFQRLLGNGGAGRRSVGTGMLVVVLALLVQAAATPRLLQVLRGPGSIGMGVAWDARSLTKHLAENLAPQDLLLSLPEPLQPSDWRERGFYQSYEFHEQNDLLPRLEPWRPGPLDLRVWYATPNAPVAHPRFLPCQTEPVARFAGCFLHRGELRVTLRERPLPPLDWSEGGLGDWSFSCPFENADHAVAGGDVDDRYLSLHVRESGADAEIASPPLEVEPGSVLSLQTSIAADQPAGMRPFGRIGVHFFDAEGERIVTRTRPGALWPDLRPIADWTPLELRTSVPRDARTARVFFALTLGNHVGCTIRVRPFVLLEGQPL